MTFDPDVFMASCETAEAGSTEQGLAPADENYVGQCVKVEAKQITSDKGTSTIFEFLYELTHPTIDLAAFTGRDKAFARYTVFLDLTPSGQLDMGKYKNVKLNRLRELYGQNQPGQRWNPQMLVGTMGKCSVSHRPNKQNPNGSAFLQIDDVRPL